MSMCTVVIMLLPTLALQAIADNSVSQKAYASTFSPPVALALPQPHTHRRPQVLLKGLRTHTHLHPMRRVRTTNRSIRTCQANPCTI